MFRALAPLAPLALLAACASDPTVYPSLAPRPVEKLGFAEPATPPPAPTVQDPALEQELAAITVKGNTAARDFDKAAARAETLARAARGAKVGSDAWIAAQTAIADLDALRSSYGDTVGALDDLAAQRAAALQPAYPALEQALVNARATAQTQTERIDALAGSLPGA
ncbi:hypothetical protein [Sphingomonas phyllosphaerae]|uniref:hypothetical protein n=1 Tax=Sphingomonas phyllosphaerae TaxID=257003 RepID=UPI00040FA199|nr:hypothetical protein [Sphingomonas phyllosphaerae]